MSCSGLYPERYSWRVNLRSRRRQSAAWALNRPESDPRNWSLCPCRRLFENFAMLPDMFCMAKDCACRPLTAVVRASNRPMTSSPQTRHTSPCRGSELAVPSQSPCHHIYVIKSIAYKKTAASSSRHPRFFLPSSGRFCRCYEDEPGCGANFSATPFMQ